MNYADGFFKRSEDENTKILTGPKANAKQSKTEIDAFLRAAFMYAEKGKIIEIIGK